MKAILQFTAESREGYNALTQGAGFLNTRGAVELAQLMAAGGTVAEAQAAWSGHVIWGNHRISGGQLSATANAWRTDVMWGSTQAPEGTDIVLGTSEDGEDDNIVWGTECGGADCVNIVWGAAEDGDAVVWATVDEGEGDPSTPLGTGTIVWGTNVLDQDDNIVWDAAAIRRQSRILATEPALR